MAAHTKRPVPVEMPPWGVGVFESHHAADFRMDVSRHDALEVFCVLGGAGVFELEGRPLACKAGHIVSVPPGHGHRIADDPDRPLSLLGVRVQPGVWAADPGLGRSVSAGRLPHAQLVVAQVRAVIRRLSFEQTGDQPGRAGMMVGLTLELLALLARSRSDSGRSGDGASDLRGRVEAYVAELAHRFYEPARLDGVACRLGMSRRRFTALFREATGTTWGDHVRGLRLEHAKRLLRSTDRSVLAVAFEAGFEDLSSFYRAFQRQEGAPPSRWRHDGA
jgi:AraC-like DNA-binding protein